MVGVAFAGAFDHDGDGDLWILHWSEADEPGEVHFLTVSAEVGGASFTGNAEVVDLHQPTGAVGADDEADGDGGLVGPMGLALEGQVHVLEEMAIAA